MHAGSEPVINWVIVPIPNSHRKRVYCYAEFAVSSLAGSVIVCVVRTFVVFIALLIHTMSICSYIRLQC